MANNNKSKDNAELEKTLIEYCTGEVAPDYALMLHGPWGSGKTFFVDRFIKDRLNTPRRHCRFSLIFLVKNTYARLMRKSQRPSPPVVSLYGVASAQDFAEALYIALHPVLSHPGMRLAGIIAKAGLKNIPYIDLSDLEKLNLTGRKKTKDRILFFDDFERAHLSGAEVLGLINPLVASGENRIVIIANEDEIDKKDDDARKKYRLAKEKTIGFTLTVQQELKKIYEFFSKDFSDEKYKNYRTFLKESGVAVQSVMQAAQSPNLRVLRIALQSFYKIFECVPEFQTEQYFQPLREMLQVVLVAFLQTRTQDTDIEVFNGRGMFYGSVTKQFTDEERKKHDEAAEALCSRFSFVRFNLLSLSYNMLEALICRSAVDADLVRETLQGDPRFQSLDNMPSWRAIVNSAYSDDAAFERSLKRFREDFDNKTFQTVADMLEACRVYLMVWCVEEEGFEDAAPLKTLKKYIDDVYKQKKYSDEYQDRFKSIEEFNPFLYRFIYSRQNSENYKKAEKYLQGVKDYLCGKHKGFLEKEFQKQVEDFLAAEKIELKSFENLLQTQAPWSKKYFPVLTYISPEKFAIKLAQQRLYAEFSDILQMFRKRHNSFDQAAPVGEALQKEKNWLAMMLTEYEKNIQSMRAIRRMDFNIAVNIFRREMRLTPHRSAGQV